MEQSTFEIALVAGCIVLVIILIIVLERYFDRRFKKRIQAIKDRHRHDSGR